MTKEKMTKNEWLKTNGFSQNGVTYIVIGNSYKIKDELKDAGFKFSPLLRWHCEDNVYLLPPECEYYTLRYEDIFTWNEEEGVTFMKEGAREYLNSIFNPIRESNSEYVGEVGERLFDIKCGVINVSGFRSAYNFSWVYTFKDFNGNEYAWITTSQQPIGEGMFYIVSGTVKKHAEYKGIKTTYLSRCSVRRINE